VIVPPQYDDVVWDFSRGLAMVTLTREGSKHRYIDKRGRTVWEGH